MFIELNIAEQKLAKFVAQMRFLANRKSGTENRKIGDQSDEDTDLEGIAAEIAWCKANNYYPDLTFNEGRPEYDATLLDGRGIDVKATKYKSGRLLAVSWKKAGEVAVYCLLIGEFPKYRIAGYLDAEELLKKDRLQRVGREPSFTALQSELRSEP